MEKINAFELINLLDSSRGQGIVHAFRQKYPGLLASPKEEEVTRYIQACEFNAILCPTRIATGWKIDPQRLVMLLSFLYYWLPARGQLWRLYGDGRKYGRRDNVIISLSNVNNCQRLNQISYHEPMEHFPICIFYGKDDRLNLEINIGNGSSGVGFLNEFCETMKTQEQEIFLTGDSVFLDHILAYAGLGGNIKDGFNIYTKMDKSSLGHYNLETGRRSDINIQIDRHHPNSLLPAIPLSNVIFDIDHGLTRSVEKILKEVIQIVNDQSSKIPGVDGIRYKQRCIESLNINLKERQIKSGTFQININSKGEVDDFTLNNKDALCLVLSEDDLPECSPVFNNVLPCDQMLPIDNSLKELLHTVKNQISCFDICTQIMHILGKMYLTLKEEKEPVLLSKSNKKSKDVTDYYFGIDDTVRASYKHYCDLFYRLYCLMFGPSKLTGYMTKFIDIAPILLNKLGGSIGGIGRFRTESGEHLHYMHQCFYYQNTSRGGGKAKPDTILMVFKWAYRKIRYKLYEYSKSEDEVAATFGQEFEVFCSNILNKHAILIQKTYKGWIQRKKYSLLQGTMTTVHNTEVGDNYTALAADNGQHEGPFPPETSSMNNFPLQGYFLLCGKLPAPMKRSDVEDKISLNGGRVLQKIPNEDTPVEVTVLTSQSECNKTNPSENIRVAYHRGWSFFSFDYVHAKIKGHPTENLCLNINSLVNTCGHRTEKSNYVYPKVGPCRPTFTSPLSQYRKRKRARAKKDKESLLDTPQKRALAEARKKKKKYCSPSKRPKRLNSLTTFKRLYFKDAVAKTTTFAEANNLLLNWWRETPAEDKLIFKDTAKIDFLNKKILAIERSTAITTPKKQKTEAGTVAIKKTKLLLLK